jgi:hypothetical protein
LGASQAEKLDQGSGITDQESEEYAEAPRFCSIDNPDCEACQ